MTLHNDLPEVFLHPGELWFGGERMRVRTILGSCVAITLWHPQRRIGGMCHYMLPGCVESSKVPRDGRYAEEAISLLREQIERNNTQPHEYEAKLFGGGNMFPPSHLRSDILPVSDRNIAVARELMTRHGFRIKAEHMGGHGHRSIIFEVNNGDVWVRQTPLPDPASSETYPPLPRIYRKQQ